MADAYVHGFILHMGLEDASFVLSSLLLSNAEQRLCLLVRTSLNPHGRCRIVRLVQLGSILMSGVSGSFGHRPVGLVRVDAGVRTLLGMVGARPHNLRSRVELNQGIHALDSPSRVETVLWRIWHLGLMVGIILRSWGHFVLLLVWWELHSYKNTLESPPRRVFPTWFLLALSASLMSS